MQIHSFKDKLNPWILLYAKVFVISIATYSFLRFSFLVWNWGLFKSIGFQDIAKAMFIGLRFDACAMAILFLPLFLISWILPLIIPVRIVKPIWVGVLALLQIPFLVLNIIDIEFFNFAGRRFTLSSLFIFQEAQGKMAGFFTTYIPGCVAGTLLIIGYLWWVNRVVKKSELVVNFKFKHFGYHFLILIILVIFGRGGVQQKPIDFVDASLFNAPVLNNLVLNSTFSLIKSSDKDKLPQVQFFTKDEEYIPLLNGYGTKKSLLEGIRLKEKQNVVIILLESFSLEYMGLPNQQHGYTPFLDELSTRSLFFKNAFANGRRSIEGVSSILAGIPALMNEAFITSEFASNYFVGLGSILSERGYHLSFFHGGNNGTMYFDRFTKSAGISNYFGANEYPNGSQDHDQIWGIYDGPFFNFFGQKLSQFQQPFLSMIFSLSSHHPYRIPEAYQNRYKKGPLEILESLQYTDESLKNFFEYAKKQSWYENTLFVITADHTHKNLLPEFDNELGRFRVPLMFFHPKMNWPEVDLNQPVQHIDILPSVLDFLGFDNKFEILLGESVFESNPDKTVLLFNDNLYYQISTDDISVWDKRGEIKHYALSDLRLANAIELAPERRAKLDGKLRASIQYFNQGMWDNRLYFPGK
jgi:phosphoglycerol transferase MdoB-like AlkP superfamily enzyme